MNKFTDLLPRAAEVQGATNDNENTAVRIGGLFGAIIETLISTMPSALINGESLSVTPSGGSITISFTTVGNTGEHSYRRITIPAVSENAAGLLTPSLLNELRAELNRAVDKAKAANLSAEGANASINYEVARATEAEKTIDDKLNEEIDRSVAADQDLLRGIDEEARRAEQAEQDIKDKAVEADSLNFQTRADVVALDYMTIEGVGDEITIPAATTESAGVMSAADKGALNNCKIIDIKDEDLAIEEGFYSGKNNKNVPFYMIVKVEITATRTRCITQYKFIDSNVLTRSAIYSLTTEVIWTDWMFVNKEKVAELINQSSEYVQNTLLAEIDQIKDGDTIVGQAREIHSRNGKTVTDSFLIRTTAGSGTIGDGVASLKSVGGSIVKNLLSTQSTIVKSEAAAYTLTDGFLTINTSGTSVYGGTMQKMPYISGHKVYLSVNAYNNDGHKTRLISSSTYADGSVQNTWVRLSLVADVTNEYVYLRVVTPDKDIATGVFSNLIVVDLTEMFGEAKANQMTKEECDRLFGTMDALPQGLSIAKPTEFKSIGFNQFNTDNVLEGKAIDDNAIVSGDKKIAVIPCLPCKVGIGENNGYCIHGDFGGDIKVYLTPLNPMEVDGELYMHELTKDATTDTYVPLIKGYLLVEVPTTANLCAHFLWSEDKCKRNSYEPYFESKIELPVIPQMSEWGLAGIQTSGTLACDEIDFERGVYVKRIQRIKLSEKKWYEASTSRFFCEFGSSYESAKANIVVSDAYISTKFNAHSQEDMTIASTGRYIYIQDSRYATADELRASFTNEYMFISLATPEEYPLPKVDNNYISSDYGVEQFDSVVPCNANNLYYMRSLAGETRNFLDRLMAGLGTSDATVVADRILAVVNPAVEPVIEEEVEP